MQTFPLTVLHRGLNNKIVIIHTSDIICNSPCRRRTLLGVGLGDLDVAAGHGDDQGPLHGLGDVEQLHRQVQAGDIVGTRRLRLVNAGQEEGEGPHGAEHVIWRQPGVVGEHGGQFLEHGEGLGVWPMLRGGI